MICNKKILKNGLRVMSIPHKDSLAATVLVLVEAGSKYETKNINGLSHFLEHMCFKGTKKRPKAIDISAGLDSLGAQYNAFTSHEYTGYYAKVESSHFDKALDIVSDIYQNPVFDDGEIEKEKGVIVEEINMYEDLPHRKVQDIMMELLYGDQPAGWSIAGNKETVVSLKKSDFLKYREGHYVASATTVVVAGKFDEKDLFEKIEEKFQDVSTGHKFSKLKTVDNQDKPAVLLSHKKSDQSHLVLAFRTCDVYDKRNYALELLANILGGSMSSRLFQRIREHMGAAYYVKADNDAYTDHGHLSISIGADNNRVRDVIVATLEECKRLKQELVSPKDLQMFKDSLIGGVVLGLETSDAVASYYGGQEILNRPIEGPEEFAAKILKVTAEEVMTEARKIFLESNINLALVGPSSDDAETRGSFAKILKL